MSRKPSVVDLSDVRAKRAMAAIQARLLPMVSETLAAEALASQVAARLAALPELERAQLRRMIALATLDLERLVREFETEQNNLGVKIHSATAHRSATLAYGRCAAIRQNFKQGD